MITLRSALALTEWDGVTVLQAGPETGTGACTSWPPCSCAPPTEGRAYYDRKKAAGKTWMEAMRCLKRRLSDVVYRTMLGDYTAGKVAGPGGQRGNVSDASATDSKPHTDLSDPPLPGPAKPKP